MALSWVRQPRASCLRLLLALGLPGRLPRRLHRRQQQGDQNADDRDHHQQFHEGEPRRSVPSDLRLTIVGFIIACSWFTCAKSRSGRRQVHHACGDVNRQAKSNISSAVATVAVNCHPTDPTSVAAVTHVPPSTNAAPTCRTTLLPLPPGVAEQARQAGGQQGQRTRLGGQRRLHARVAGGVEDDVVLRCRCRWCPRSPRLPVRPVAYCQVRRCRQCRSSQLCSVPRHTC